MLVIVNRALFEEFAPEVTGIKEIQKLTQTTIKFLAMINT